jgi:hypothetical protein
MARDSRLWQNPLAHARIFEGDAAECNKWYAWAQQKLRFMLANHPGATSQVFVPIADVTVKVDTRPNRIYIRSNPGTVFPTFRPSSTQRRLYTGSALATAFKLVDDPYSIPYGFWSVDEVSKKWDGSWTNNKDKATRWSHLATSIEVVVGRSDALVSVSMSGESPYIKLYSAGVSKNKDVILVFINYTTGLMTAKKLPSPTTDTSIAYAAIPTIASPTTYIWADMYRVSQLDESARSIVFLTSSNVLSYLSFSEDFTTYSEGAVYTLALTGSPLEHGKFVKIFTDGVGFTAAIAKSGAFKDNVAILFTPTYTPTTVSWAASGETFLYADEADPAYYYFVYRLIYASREHNTYVFVRYAGSGAGDTFFDMDVIYKRGGETSVLSGPASILGFISSSESTNAYLGLSAHVRAKDLVLLTAKIKDFSGPGVYYYLNMAINLATGSYSTNTDVSLSGQMANGLAITT